MAYYELSSKKLLSASLTHNPAVQGLELIDSASGVANFAEDTSSPLTTWYYSMKHVEVVSLLLLCAISHGVARL